MSDLSTSALDPKRPWLTDERELPHHMNWMEILFNPTGTSPRLHFTRAWTLLFTLQLLIIVVPWTIALILNVAGGDGKPVGTFGVYATPVVFIVTTLMSYVIHSRRLLDAGKTPLFAMIPLIPLIIGVGLFMVTAMGQAAQYDKRFETRQEFLADPDAFRAKQRAEQEKAREEAEKRAAEAAAERGETAEGEHAAAQGESQPQRRRAGAGGRGMNLEAPLPPKHEAVLKASLPVIQTVIIPMSGFIAIWSLMWVARSPLYGPTYIYEQDSYRFAFLSWRGRLSRKRFALGQLFLLLAQFAAMMVLGAAAAITQSMLVYFVPSVLLGLAMTYFSLALTTKRIHDLGYDVLSILKFAVPAALVLAGANAVVFFATGGNVPAWFLVLTFIPAAIGALAAIVFIVWLWAGEPQLHDNKHGRAPEVIPAEVPAAAS